MRIRGFTIVELVIVITIMGILLALGVVNLSNSQANGRDSERKIDIETIASHLETYYQSGKEGDATTIGQYPSTKLISSTNTESVLVSYLRDINVKSMIAPGADSVAASFKAATNDVQTTADILPQPTIGTYVYQPLTSYGTLCNGESSKIEVLVVGGGGSGGTASSGGGGGGGGAGGVVSESLDINTNNYTYSITIGAGGGSGSNGQDSSFSNIVIAKGGGKGGAINVNGSSGGSGGGAGAGGVGTLRLGGVANPSISGNNGGNDDTGHSGGGGGAGGRGSDGGVPAAGGGAGGIGIMNSISGINKYYGGGGSGGYGSSVGGLGGGGQGATGPSSPATSGQINTGGGGGGAYNTYGAPGNGGSGIVIIKYPTGTIDANITGTGNTTTQLNGYTIHTFTSSGNFNVTGSNALECRKFNLYYKTEDGVVHMITSKNQ